MIQSKWFCFEQKQTLLNCLLESNHCTHIGCSFLMGRGEGGSLLGHLINLMLLMKSTWEIRMEAVTALKKRQTQISLGYKMGLKSKRKTSGSYRHPGFPFFTCLLSSSCLDKWGRSNIWMHGHSCYTNVSSREWEELSHPGEKPLILLPSDQHQISSPLGGCQRGMQKPIGSNWSSEGLLNLLNDVSVHTGEGGSFPKMHSRLLNVHFQTANLERIYKPERQSM